MQRRVGEREVPGADPTHGSDVLTSHHRQPLCWESAAGMAVVPAPRTSASPLLGEPGPRIGEVRSEGLHRGDA